VALLASRYNLCRGLSLFIITSPLARLCSARHARQQQMAASAFVVLLLLLGCLAAPQRGHAAPAGAEVTRVPGFGGALPSRHFAGYVTVDEAHGRRLFYYLVESERDPGRDPVVLWLNGGPGCSSFDGFVYEQGTIFSFLRSLLRLLVLADPARPASRRACASCAVAFYAWPRVKAPRASYPVSYPVLVSRAALPPPTHLHVL
jgi:hypothetical protein